MSRNKRTILLLFSSYILSFVANAQKENITPSTHPTVKNSAIKNFTITKGRSTQEFLLTNNKKWSIALQVPDIKKGDKVPLILALHWAGGGDTYKEYSNCLAFPALDFMGGIIVAPSADGGHWLDPHNEAKVIKLVKQLIKYWPIDPNRVIVTGYSNGGIGSWHYAQKYPQLFNAGLPIAGSYRTSKIKVPLYILHGEKDDLFPAKQVEETIRKSINKGSDITYKKIPGFTHYTACSYTTELQEIAKKMMQDLQWKPGI